METLTLSDEHRQLLTDSGISDSVAMARGYRTISDPHDPAINHYSVAQRRTLPALFLPSYNVHGEQVGSQLRPDNPRNDAKGRELKYESASGAGSFLDVHPDIRERLVSGVEPIIITEGVRKADAVNSQGYLCLALPGVWNFIKTVAGKATAVNPDFSFIPMKDRRVIIVFDNDVSRKPEVASAMRRLAMALDSKSAKVEIALLPESEEKVGLDDYLMDNHTVEDVWGLAKPVKDVLGDLDAQFARDHFYDRTHLGNAERIMARVGDSLAWCPSTGWYVWDGTVWIRDAEHLVRKHIHALRDIIDSEVEEMVKAGVGDEEVGRHRKLRYDCQTDNHIKAVLSLLRELVLHTWDEFDQRPDMITVGNGTLVFGQYGEVELQDFDPANMLTRKTDINYNPDAKAPFFESTVQMALPEEDVRTFFQRAVGYSMTGGNAEQVIFMAHGSGENLKSTVLGAVKRALGKELGLEVDPASLRPSDRGGSSASPDKMRLVGSRMVLAAEASDKLDPEFLKRVSGGEEIVARQLHGKSISFVPDFTLWLMFNAPPSIEDSGHGMWRRVRVIPFTHRVKDPIDSGTVNRLLNEQMEGILAWMVRGYTDYKQHGLTPPEAVLVETQAMRDELDWMADFIGQNYVVGEEGTFTKKSDVWKTFEQWRGMDFELRNVRKLDFNAKLTDRWGPSKKVRGHFGWSGVRHNDDPIPETGGNISAPGGNSRGNIVDLASSDLAPLSREDDTQGAKNGSRGQFSSVSYESGGSDTDSDHFLGQGENEDQMTDFCPPSTSSQVNGGVVEGKKYPTSDFTSSVSHNTFSGSYDRLRGGSRPAKLGTCGRVPWKSSPRMGGCGTDLTALPDSGYIGVCPKCHPDSVN